MEKETKIIEEHDDEQVFASLIVRFDEEISKRGGDFYRVEVVLPEESNVFLKKSNGGIILPKNVKISNFTFIGQEEETKPMSIEELSALKMQIMLHKQMEDLVQNVFNNINQIETNVVDNLAKIREYKNVFGTLLGITNKVEEEVKVKKIAKRRSKKND